MLGNKKILKTVKYSLSLLISVVILLLVLPWFIDVNDYKLQIIEQVEDTTDCTLDIGKIQISLFPWVGVRLENVTLSNRQGFTERDFLKIEALDIQLAMIPLLSDEIEIKRFLLLAPELYLERNQMGESNWQDLMVSSDAPKVEIINEGAGDQANAIESSSIETSSDKASLLAAFNADLLQLKNGKVIWVDALRGQTMNLQDIQVKLSDVQLQRAMNIKASLMLGSKAVNLDGLIGPVGDLAALDMNHLPIQARVYSDGVALADMASWLPLEPEMLPSVQAAYLGFDVQLEQRPNAFRLSSGHLQYDDQHSIRADWKLEMPRGKRLDVRDLTVAVNDKKVVSMQGDVKLGQRLRYQLRIKGEPLARKWLVALSPQVATWYGKHPKPWNHISFGALIAGGEDRLEVRDLKLLMDGELVQASGVVGFAKAPDIRLRVVSQSLHLDPWLPHVVKTRVAKSKAAKSKAIAARASLNHAISAELVAAADEPDLRFLRSWLVNGQLQVDRLYVQGLELGRMRVKIHGKKGGFVFDPLRFEVAGGQVSQKVTMNTTVYPIRWRESLRVSGVNIAPVLQSQWGYKKLSGVLQLETDLSGVGLSSQTYMPSLNGRAYLSLRDGSFKGFDIAGILRYLDSPGDASPSKQTDFAQLDGNFTIRQGQMSNDDLYMASPLFRLTGQGKVNLPASTLDYHVKPRLIGSLIGQGDTEVVRKGLAVPLHITGALNAPNIAPKIDAKALLDRVVDTLADPALENKAKKALNKLLGL